MSPSSTDPPSSTAQPSASAPRPDQPQQFGIRQIIRTSFSTLVATALLLAIYALAPIGERPHEPIWARLTLGAFLFAAVLGWQIRAITVHDHPELRAVTALAIVLPLFVIVFAWMYLNASISAPEMFGISLNRVSALYFTISTFSTVGYGDITPKTSVAQAIVTVQIIADLAFIALGIGSILKIGQRHSETASDH